MQTPQREFFVIHTKGMLRCIHRSPVIVLGELGLTRRRRKTTVFFDSVVNVQSILPLDEISGSSWSLASHYQVVNCLHFQASVHPIQYM